MQSGREDTLKERCAIKLCFKLGKNATETYGMLQTAFGASCMNRESVFEWHKRFKERRESVKYDDRCGRSKEVRTPELIGQGVREFRKRFLGKRPALFKSGQWHFHEDNAPVHNSILVTDSLEIKESVTKVIDMLTQEDFHGAFQKLLGWYNKCISTGGDYSEGG